MILENALFVALAPLVGSRMSPNIFPQPPDIPTWPAIRYTFISTVPIQDLCGDGDDDTADTRVQLDIVAKTFKAVRQLRLDVIAAMQSFDPPARVELSSSDYDAETKTYREILDYSFYGSSQSGNSP
jgi:Protein of unknown function (DUF3168)